VSATPLHDEFSPLERAALAHWRAPLPPADFADRVLARAAGEVDLPQPRPAPAPGRLAVAALALLALGGLLSMRSMLGGAGSPAHELPGGLGGYDAGQRPEVPEDVRDDFDGMPGRPS
jgi:hypothetical protein